MASVSTAISETGESIVPDSTTTNLERTEEFCRGQDILFKAKDGKYYLGTVAELDPGRERCLVKFADGTDSWALFKQLERLSAPTLPPIPDQTSPQPAQQQLNPTATAVKEEPLVDWMFLRMCVVCKRSAPLRLKEIAQCTKCGRGYHASCHVPVIGANVMKDEKAFKWLCRRCYEYDTTKFAQKTREILVTPKTRGSDKNIDLTGIGIPDETLETLRSYKLPYDLESLSWDPSHRYNIEQRYCYCGLSGDWTRCMLQCGRCKQWFHGQCIICLRRPLFAGDQFYVFVCALCHRKDRQYTEKDNRCISVKPGGGAQVAPKFIDESGEEIEFIRRLEMKWVDLIHLMLFNLTTYNSKKYFDLDGVLIPYIRDNWHGLQLPLKIANCTTSERRSITLAVLTTNRNRFKLKINSTAQHNSNIWGLRVRLPPPASVFTLPPKLRIGERVLKQYLSENKRVQLLANPPLGSEFTMGGLLVTRGTMHCEKVGVIMRGTIYQDSADSEIDDLSLSPHHHNPSLHSTTSTSCQTTSSTILRQRTNPVQYAPGSVKKSASTVAPGNKKILPGATKQLDAEGKMRDWNKPVWDRNSVYNNEAQTTDDSFSNKANGASNNQNKKRHIFMKRNETRKLLRRKCRMEQERNKTEKRRTRLSIDANHKSDSSYPSPNLPPTPPTSVSDPPTPPSVLQSDYASDTQSAPGKHETKLTRANLSDRDKMDPNFDNRAGFATPCDTSGDEASSKSTLDLIIPPPKDFEGRNNPFSLGEKSLSRLNVGGKKKGADKKVVGQIKGGAKQGVVKTMKRQLSAKDIRIGPNGEVKRRRIRRSLPLQQSTNPTNSSTLPLQTNSQPSPTFMSTNSLTNQASTLTGDESWAPSVGNCMEYVLNGRRLRVRQEKQLQQQGNGAQQAAEEQVNKKSLMVIGGVMLAGVDAGLMSGGGSAKGSPVKTGGQESDISMDDLKSSVSSYFGAATRIAAGERYTVRARRIGPTGNVQYLIEWDRTSSTNSSTQLNNPLYSTPQHSSINTNLDFISGSSNNQYYSSRTTPSDCNQSIHNPYYNRSTSLSTSKIGSSSTAASSGNNKTGSSSTGKLPSSSKGFGKMTLGSSKGSLNVARVLTLDSLRAFNNEL